MASAFRPCTGARRCHGRRVLQPPPSPLVARACNRWLLPGGCSSTVGISDWPDLEQLRTWNRAGCRTERLLSVISPRLVV
eukprot:3932706-Prymnesium_polylepis.1